MTILSWPHWSLEIQNLADKHYQLPWLFCHGPIEATHSKNLFSVKINFHDYFVMAPLKPKINALLVREGKHFHDYFVMAPLKPLSSLGCNASFVTSMTILSWPHWSSHGYNKRHPRRHTSMTILSWPHWSPSNRQTEKCLTKTSMTILSWPHWSLLLDRFAVLQTLDFHDYFVMAPLKQWTI